MKAARFYNQKDIRIEEVEEAPLEPGTARVKVAWCGICGTDLHEYLEGPIFPPQHGESHPISGESLPITLGHEMSGVIAEVADDVTDLAVGDHVVVEPYIIGDDVDTSESNPIYHLSPNMNFIGLAGRGGGLAENLVVQRRWIHKISPDLPLDEAALIEPLSVAVHAVERAGITSEADGAGKTALVGGAGPIGLLTAAVLKAFGLTVYVTELSPLRREKALDAGVVDEAFNPKEVDVVAEIRKRTNDQGVDFSFEATSVQAAVDTLVDATRNGGVLLIESIWGHKGELDFQKVVLKELDVRGSIAYAHSHATAISLVEDGKVNLAPFITGKIGLEGLIDEGFDTLINRNETAVKILVSPSGEGL